MQYRRHTIGSEPHPPLLAGPRERLADERVAVEGNPAFDALARRAASEGKPLRWVVVDDLYEDACELAISPWPRLTDEGRLVFAESEQEHLVAEIPGDELLELVRAARARHDPGAEPAIVNRPLRVGDTFAAVLEVVDPPPEAPPGGHRAKVGFPWGADGILDVTADARVFAKVQVAVAEVPPIAPDELDDLRRGLES